MSYALRGINSNIIEIMSPCSLPVQSIVQPSTLSDEIAQRVQVLRKQQGLSIEELAAKSQVSRSMISAVERAQVNATAQILDRLASALGVALTQLLEVSKPAHPLSRAADQLVWQEPSTGYLRRSLSPPGAPGRLRLIEVQFPSLARIAYEANAAQPPILQQVWLIEGSMEITVTQTQHILQAGDCLAMTVDQPIVFFNPGAQAARYLVAQA